MTQHQGDNSFLEALRQNYGNSPNESKLLHKHTALNISIALFTLGLRSLTSWQHLTPIILTITGSGEGADHVKQKSSERKSASNSRHEANLIQNSDKNANDAARNTKKGSIKSG